MMAATATTMTEDVVAEAFWALVDADASPEDRADAAYGLARSMEGWRVETDEAVEIAFWTLMNGASSARARADAAFGLSHARGRHDLNEELRRQLEAEGA